MYEPFTDRSRKVMRLATQEAHRLNHEYIGTEHVLLGLIKEGGGVATSVFRWLSVDPLKIASEVEKVVQSHPVNEPLVLGRLPHSPRTKEVIGFASEESRNLKYSHVGTEHLLLGLLRAEECVAAQVLIVCGVTLLRVRSAILELVGDRAHVSGEQVHSEEVTERSQSLLKDPRTPFQKWVAGDGPYEKPRSIYVASSWRNPLQPAVVATLRAANLDVYDFRNPPGATGFSWRSIDPEWRNWTPAQWRDALRTDLAREGYASDRAGMDRADCCVLVLPCGRSAHLEAGFMAGQGKPVFTLALESVEPELMSLLLGPPDHICVSMADLFDRLGVPN